MENNTQNNYTTPVYSAQPYQAPVQKTNGAGVASLVCGIICFFINPLYFVGLAAIITGIVGLSMNGRPKGTAAAGLILGIIGSICQILFDIIITILTLGMGVFFIFI